MASSASVGESEHFILIYTTGRGGHHTRVVPRHQEADGALSGQKLIQEFEFKDLCS